MECERFKHLLKSWYIQVQDEALAPARMVEFMEQHVADCPVCIMDPEAKTDITKIITLVLPKDKLKPAARSKHDDDEDIDPEAETDEEASSDDDEDEKDEFADDDDDIDPDEDEDEEV
jgi:hypothetical protein